MKFVSYHLSLLPHGNPRIRHIPRFCVTCNLSMLVGAIIQKGTAPYSCADCIVDVYIYFLILALTSDSEFSTLSKLIFLSVLCVT